MLIKKEWPIDDRVWFTGPYEQHFLIILINPFTAEVAIMRLLDSAEVAFVRPEKEEQSDWLV
jgi:hypothetical protein